MESTDTLIRPIISEKSLTQASLSWYTFAVNKQANKPTIKKEIERVFKVKVLKVKTMIVKGKTKRVGKRLKSIKQSSWKKAYVLLPKDQKIELFEIQGAHEHEHEHEHEK